MNLSLSPSDALRLAHNSCSFEDYLSLGASLYIPASREDLVECINGDRLRQVRSMIICTEDAIADNELLKSLHHIEALLSKTIERSNLYVRPRSPHVLSELVSMRGSEQLTGVVLPKIDERSLSEYMSILSQRPSLRVMPTIEGSIAFDQGRLNTLRGMLERLINPIICLRIGANDLMSLLSLKRPRSLTIYETPLRSVIDQLILTFRLAGYHIAAPVFDLLDHEHLLARELERDGANGLWSKTAIHPDQVALIESRYKVDARDLEMAEAILARNAPAVFRLHDQMCEPCIHRPWAEQTLSRAKVYGVFEG